MIPAVRSAVTFKFIPEMIKNMDMTGGVKWFTCLNSFLSLVTFIYVAPNTMQDRRGESWKNAQMPEIPSSIATARIRRLSLLLAGVRSFDSTTPHKNPRTSAMRFQKMGTITSVNEIWPLVLALTTATTALKVRRHTTSSRATTCRRTLTKSPLAWY